MITSPRRALAAALLLVTLAGCESTETRPDYGRPLPPGAPALIKLGPGDPHPDWSVDFTRRSSLQAALQRSIEWMGKPSSKGFFPIEGISHETALASLQRFGELLATSPDGQAFAAAVDRDFDVYMSAGWDGRGGGVLFTGYCTPILDGSLQRTSEFRYPLYGLPPDLVKGKNGEILGRQTGAGLVPYPTRAEIDSGRLLEGRNLELAWLRDPLDAYIAHVNGSAVIRLPDGTLYRLGYAAKNGREYVSARNALVADGKLPADTANLTSMREWSQRHPGEIEPYLERNESYVFFLPIDGNPRGSLNVEVTAERTLATDKSLFPRGAVTFVDTSKGKRGGRHFHQFLMDQDTGGAIRTAGRADVYLGIGPAAERLAGATEEEGQLYYLFLRAPPAASGAGSRPEP